MSTTNPKSNSGRVLVSFLLIVAALAAAGGIIFALVKSKPEAERREREHVGVLVAAEAVTASSQDVSLSARGTVQPARQIVLSPEVNGRVRWQSDNLVPGGRVSARERLIRLDARDYRLQVDSSGAEVNRAQLELQMERSRREVAVREWQAFGDDAATDDRARALATRQPQLQTAEVGVQAAESAAGRARLNLSRTTIRAPFNGMIVQEAVDVGQIVGPSSQLATLVGTDAFWVQVSVPVESLTTIHADEEDGSEATVVHTVGSERIEHAGRVIRLLPDLDPTGAMARVIVEVRDPLGLEEGHDVPVPLLLGSYVEVEIAATRLENIIEVPRSAVHEGNIVYVLSPENTLIVRNVEVAWGRRNSVLVSSGLSPGDLVIRSRVGTPVPGMLLRQAEAQPATTASAGQTEAANRAESP